IHLGTAWNKILKDTVIRFRRMQKYNVRDQAGFDMHGLPIEVQVEKTLGIDDKKQIEEMGIDIFVNKCKEFALDHKDRMIGEFKSLGVWLDWDDPYITIKNDYIQSEWWTIKKAYEKNLLTEAERVLTWCPRCQTALAEAEVEYWDETDPSIYVRFPLKGSDKESMLIWTTTPWTLPANMAVAVNPEFTYAKVKFGTGRKKETMIMIEDKVDDIMTLIDCDDYDIVELVGGSQLAGLEYHHPFLKELKFHQTLLGEWIHKVLLSDTVTPEYTGIVHIAPGHGPEDFDIGKEHDLPPFCPVTEDGKFSEDAGRYANIPLKRGNHIIIQELKRKGLLLFDDDITHRYGHCWRCKTPIIYRTTDQWFLKITEIKDDMLEEISEISWYPDWAGSSRMQDWVSNARDWCISRQRSWGVPITLIRCEKCNEFVTDRKVMEKIEQEVESSGADIWFEKTEKELMPDGYKCKCGSDEFKKETDILDVWFDSGVSHAAVAEADERLSSPADMYLEGSDQHRGWFQSSLLTSVGTRGRAPYGAVLTHGFVVDGKGKKMSKSIGNVISPQEITTKYGSEILRLWCSSADYRDDMKISNEIMARLVEAYRKIRNTSRFILGNINDLDPAAAEINITNLSEIDRVALDMLQDLVKKVTASYESFAFYEVYHAIYQFCIIDMSSFYFDILKDRLYTFRTDSSERRNAQAVLYNILKTLTKLIAPILSFTAEEIWKHLPGEKEESIFLAKFPALKEEFIIDDLLKAKWQSFIAIRNEVNKALEIKRADKMIGNALEARVTIYVNDKTKAELEAQGDFLPALFIVSAVDIKGISEAPEEAYSAGDVEDLAVLVEIADGTKCQRCWNISTSVGTFDEHPELCERCYNVLKN
ncbi:MAG: isoleucine--tRNA ligase, partial [Thermoplasmata archaeon]|nr:isoleucine--tRNA ligase [Thermoplasmata archaeon]